MGSYSRLLLWHAAHIRSVGHVEFASNILRTRSTALHDIMAYITTYDKYTTAELRDIVSTDELGAIKIRTVWLAALGRVVALQALDNLDSETSVRDLEFGLACLSFANQSLPRNQEHQQFHRLEIELLIMLGRVDDARTALDGNEFLIEYYYGYLLSDLDHPKNSGTVHTSAQWVEGFNRPFVENELQIIKPSSLLQQDYNALRSEMVSQSKVDPKVSVIMTSYRPDRDDFLTAVNSILCQTWQNFELIIVDDASPTEFNHVLAEAESLDPRVRIIRLDVNGGTYRARNIGIGKATGELMTGQDSDDWSHPQRLAVQVDYLVANPKVPGVVVEAIRINNRLLRTFPGRIPHGNCEVSFMLSIDLAREVGGYMDARKGADGEFRRRVERYTGKKVDAIQKPLYLIRIGHDSLSNADFRPGWAHPIRRTFWNSSRYWHENTPAKELRVGGQGAQPIPIPNRFKIEQAIDPPHYDVVYVGDWRSYASTQRTMIDEIVALREYGKKVGILHLESLMSPSKEPTRFCYEIQTMVNEREVSVVIPDEGASTNLAIIHDPTILQFISTDGLSLTAQLLIIKPDIPPPASNGPVMYLPEVCDHKARVLFDSNVVWAATDPAVTRILARYHSKIELHDEQYPVVFRPQRWHNTRRRLGYKFPIIGRHSANYEAHWPQDLATCTDLWPTEGESEVQILGDARSFLRKYSRPRFPYNWVVFRDKEIRPEAFMSGIDFFVYFPSEDYPQKFCREALEAAASGAMVILPERFKNTHVGTALYVTPEEVPELISHYFVHTSDFSHKVEESYKSMQHISVAKDLLEYLDRLENKYQPTKARTWELDA